MRCIDAFSDRFWPLGDVRLEHERRAAFRESSHSTLPRKHLLEITLSFASSRLHVGVDRLLLAGRCRPGDRIVSDCY